MLKGSPNPLARESARRRSQRVMLNVPISVRTQGTGPSNTFQEDTTTLVVNAHGALIALAGKVEKGQVLRLTNRATREEQNCRVVYSGPIADGKAQVGIEFLQPSPDFWRIAFPPEDWAVPENSALT
jgi:hypothetical protein